MTESTENRRHARCIVVRKIVFSRGSQAEFHLGLAKNHSRYSLYFESPVALVPGTLLFIRSTGGDRGEAGETDPLQDSREPDKGAGHRRSPTVCSELKTVVVAQVRRCVEIAGDGEALYGTGVEYVSPAV